MRKRLISAGIDHVTENCIAKRIGTHFDIRKDFFLALGIACVPFLTMSLVQLDWIHRALLPVLRKSIAAGPLALTQDKQLRARQA
jgi:hypothetical protein